MHLDWTCTGWKPFVFENDLHLDGKPDVPKPTAKDFSFPDSSPHIPSVPLWHCPMEGYRKAALRGQEAARLVRRIATRRGWEGTGLGKRGPALLILN